MPDFHPDFLLNLTLLGLIALLLAVCIVVAARFRQLWGITPVAVLTGLFQLLQTVLAIGLSISVFQGVEISPGSVAVFPATLFAILLVYVLEDESEARRLVYGVVLANLALGLLLFLVSPLVESPGATSRLGLDGTSAIRLARLLMIGTVLFAMESFILIRAFEWFGEHISRNLLVRAPFALGLCLAFDAIFFSFAAFGTSPRFGTVLAIDLMGKLVAGSLYSFAFVFLLPWSQVSGEAPIRARGDRRRTGPITYKERYHDLQKVAVRDALTDVFNRAYFDHELPTQTDRALIRGERLLLLLIDLDSFKKINDTYGHPAGDRVLTLFGGALRAVARQNDTVCRYGGEEFAILIAGGPVAIGPRLFERMEEEVARLWSAATPAFTFEPPTFSVGGAAAPEDAQSAERLLAVADQRLYVSKRAGGNRLTIG